MLHWVQEIAQLLPSEVISIDGKTLKHGIVSLRDDLKMNGIKVKIVK